MAYPYITESDVRARIGLTQTDRIYDDDEIGTASEAAITALVRDGSSRVASALRASRRYNIDLIADDPPAEVIRLSLDVAEVYAAKRHPEVVRKDWVPLNEAVERELKALVKGEMMLDTTAVLSGDDGETPAGGGGTPIFATDLERGW